MLWVLTLALSLVGCATSERAECALSCTSHFFISGLKSAGVLVRHDGDVVLVVMKTPLNRFASFSVNLIVLSKRKRTPSKVQYI